MSAFQTLERVAELLSSPERERFLTCVARFRNIPEDDEYLQVLEAIGFMTLIWSKIPAEIHSILEGAKPANPNTEYLNAQIRSAIQENIPSFEDLRQISQSLNQQQVTLKRHLLLPPPSSYSSPGRAWRFFFMGIFVGLIVAAFLIFSGKVPIS
jgi:hypothetical protein